MPRGAFKLFDRFKPFFSRFRPDWVDFFGILGFSSVFYGVYQAYPPAAFVVSGVILMAISFYKARK
jgi:hypothetical protein